jgi:hypothetical protein
MLDKCDAHLVKYLLKLQVLESHFQSWLRSCMHCLKVKVRLESSSHMEVRVMAMLVNSASGGYKAKGIKPYFVERLTIVGSIPLIRPPVIRVYSTSVSPYSR